jgi:hypothetical protein
MKNSIPVIIAILFAFTSVHAEPGTGKTAPPVEPVIKTEPVASKDQKKPEALKDAGKSGDIRDSGKPVEQKKAADVKKKMPAKKKPAAPAAGKKPKRDKEAKKTLKPLAEKKAEKLKEPEAGSDIRDPVRADEKKDAAGSGEPKDREKSVVPETKKKPADKKVQVKPDRKKEIKKSRGKKKAEKPAKEKAALSPADSPVKDIRDAKASGDKNIPPDQKAVKDQKDTTSAHVIVINPGSSDAASFSASWGHVRDSRVISNWGRNFRIFLYPDSGPVSDGLAAYLGPEGTTILDVRGLKPEAAYSLWIDFAVFRNPDRVMIPSTLKVFVSGGQYPFREVAGFSFNEMKPGAVRISIPYELTVSGDIRIMLKEYSQSRNTWAVWDIIVSDSPELPAAAAPAPDNKEKKRLEPRHNILE